MPIGGCRPKKKIDSYLHTCRRNGESLKLSSGQLRQLTVAHRLQLHLLDVALHLVTVVTRLEGGLHGSLHGPRDLVDVLNLRDGLDLLLKHLLEVRLELGPSEVLQDLRPLWGGLEVAKVGLDLSSKDLEGCGLADTVGPNETEDLPWAWERQSVELEGVGAVSVGCEGGERLREVDDLDGLKGALLCADVAPDAELLRQPCVLAGGLDLDAQGTSPHHGAELLALLLAPTRLALILSNNGNTGQLPVIVLLLLTHFAVIKFFL